MFPFGTWRRLGWVDCRARRATGTYTEATSALAKIICDSGTPQIKVNVAGTEVITSNDSDIPRASCHVRVPGEIP